MLELSQARLHLQKGVQENFWPGFTLAIFSRGKFAAYTGGNVPTPATSVCWYSAGKPVTSLGVLHLTEQKPDLWPLPMGRGQRSGFCSVRWRTPREVTGLPAEYQQTEVAGVGTLPPV